MKSSSSGSSSIGLASGGGKILRFASPVLLQPWSAALVCAVAALALQDPAHADTFGSGTNAFTLQFSSIGNTSNAADANGYGAVPYEYRLGTYEISQNDIDKATASGMTNITSGTWTGSQPAANMSWYEAAAFTNWLNTSKGYQPAYNLTNQGVGQFSMALWSSEQAWTLGGTNLYRHKDAVYFLPSENEWYKGAYYNPAGASYFLYPTASNTAPTAVASGTTAGTAVYVSNSAPAGVTDAGGLSPYGVMGLGGNVREWMETAFDGVNSSPTEPRAVRGGAYESSSFWLSSSTRFDDNPQQLYTIGGFRVAAVVATVPEPSAVALACAGLACGGFSMWRRRKRA